MSLVVSKRSVTKYQLVFRHLFFGRHVERCLKQTWQGQQRLKELDVRAAGGRSYCLRHRMLGFMQDIVYYFTYEVKKTVFGEKGSVLPWFYYCFLPLCLASCLQPSFYFSWSAFGFPR